MSALVFDRNLRRLGLCHGTHLHPASPTPGKALEAALALHLNSQNKILKELVKA